MSPPKNQFIEDHLILDHLYNQKIFLIHSYQSFLAVKCKDNRVQIWGRLVKIVSNKHLKNLSIWIVSMDEKPWNGAKVYCRALTLIHVGFQNLFKPKDQFFTINSKITQCSPGIFNLDQNFYELSCFFGLCINETV